MTQKIEASEIAVLNLKEGDTLFVNADAIDIEGLRKLRVPFVVPVVAVYCLPGMSVVDQLTVTRTEAASEQSNG